MYKLGTYIFNTLFKLSAPDKDRKNHRIRNYLGNTFYNLKYVCEKHIEDQENYLYKEASKNKTMKILELSKKDMEDKEICIASFVYSKAVMPYVKEYIHRAENVVQSLKKMKNRVPLKYVNLKIESLNRSRLTKKS